MRPRFSSGAVLPHLGWLGPFTLLLAACGAAPPPHTAGEAHSPDASLSADAAATQIARARCDREVACGSVGTGRMYPARDECTRDFLRSAQTDLANQACPSGIGARRLDDCTGRLRKESCHPLSTLSLMDACRPAALCSEASPTAAFWTPAP